MYGEIGCMARYNVWRDTMYGEIQCMARQDVWRDTMYGETRCMARYNVSHRQLTGIIITEAGSYL